MTGPNDWQKAQGAKCPCRGSDDMCACQNVDAAHRLAHSPAASDGLREAVIQAVGLGLRDWMVKHNGGVITKGMSREMGECIADRPEIIALLPAGGEATFDEWTVAELRASAQASVDAPGCSHNQFAREKGISSAKLSEFLSGKRGGEPSIIEPMGFRWALVNANDYPRREDLPPNPDRARGRLEGLEKAAAIKLLRHLEFTEDGYSLRTPYDGDVDDDTGRHVVVGGELVATFVDSDEGEELIAAIRALRGEGS